LPVCRGLSCQWLISDEFSSAGFLVWFLGKRDIPPPHRKGANWEKFKAKTQSSIPCHPKIEIEIVDWIRCSDYLWCENESLSHREVYSLGNVRTNLRAAVDEWLPILRIERREGGGCSPSDPQSQTRARLILHHRSDWTMGAVPFVNSPDGCFLSGRELISQVHNCGLTSPTVSVSSRLMFPLLLFF